MGKLPTWVWAVIGILILAAIGYFMPNEEPSEEVVEASATVVEMVATATDAL